MHKHQVGKWIPISITFVLEQILTCSQLAETISDWATIPDGNRERLVGQQGAAGKSWFVSYFRNAWEETYWSGHLDSIRTSSLRGARQSLSTPLSTVVQKKIYLLKHPHPTHTNTHLFYISPTIFVFFLPEVEKKSHLHQAKLWWAALSVQKTWGFDSSHSMVINYFSTVVGSPLPSCSMWAAPVDMVLAGGNTW